MKLKDYAAKLNELATKYPDADVVIADGSGAQDIRNDPRLGKMVGNEYLHGYRNFVELDDSQIVTAVCLDY